MTTFRTGAAVALLSLAASGCMSDDATTKSSTTAQMSASDSMQANPPPAMPRTPPAQMIEKTVMVGGAAMYPSKTIVENATNSADHTTLVAAVKAAGLVETLSGAGPFTVFAPTNAAFGKLPSGTVDGLVKPEMKMTLQKVLTFHVVSGRMTAADISKAIQSGGGKAMLKTVSGGTLTATMAGATLMLTDEKGGMSHVTIGDVMQSNGVIHVVDTVLMPG
jgi:uncharacterized surface protein with fasciclin (FAS1) repeats